MQSKIKNIVAIVPARSGSKRIKDKNIKKFLNEPIIKNTLRVLKTSKIFNRILVSSDSKKIINLSKSIKGIEAPFIRPKSFSHDNSSTVEVVKHAIRYLNETNYDFDYVCCVYPPNPFLRSKDIINGFKLVKKNKNSFVFSATKFFYPVERSFYLQKGKIKTDNKKNFLKRSQNIKELYCDAAQFYWGHKNSWNKNLHVFQKDASIIQIPNYRFCDINTLEDWKRAEKLKKII